MNVLLSKMPTSGAKTDSQSSVCKTFPPVAGMRAERSVGHSIIFFAGDSTAGSPSLRGDFNASRLSRCSSAIRHNGKRNPTVIPPHAQREFAALRAAFLFEVRA